MLHAGQVRVLERAARFNAVACGRRFGKTTLGVALAAHGAPHSPGGLLAGYSVGWFAPTYRLLDEAWRAARQAWHGMARQGMARQGRAGWARHGLARHGAARQGAAGQGRRGKRTWTARR